MPNHDQRLKRGAFRLQGMGWRSSICGSALTLVMVLAATGVYGQTRRSPSSGSGTPPVTVKSPQKPTVADEKKPTFTVNLPTPPNLGAPTGRVRGGASRGACPGYEQLKALVPQMDSKRAWGLTSSARPVFWFYLPERVDQTVPIEFVLQDPQDQYIYRTVLTPTITAAGIVSIALPETTQPLQPGVLYQWTMSMNCDPDRRTQFAFIRGNIQREVSGLQVSSLVLQQQERLSQAALLDTASRLANNGIWYDAVTALGQSRRQWPEAVQAEQFWQILLREGGLSDLQSAPLLACCSSEPKLPVVLSLDNHE